MTRVSTKSGALHEAQLPQRFERLHLPHRPRTTNSASSDFSPFLPPPKQHFYGLINNTSFLHAHPSRSRKTPDSEDSLSMIATMSRVLRQLAAEVEQLEGESGYQSGQFEDAREEYKDQEQELEVTSYELERTRKKLMKAEQELEATRQELEAERQDRLDFAKEAATMLREVEDAVIGRMKQIDISDDFDCDRLSSLATRLRDIERLTALRAEAETAKKLAAAKKNVERLADRHHFQSLDTILQTLCDKTGLHTQLGVELVLCA
jgi:chromosome segregation ATPase